MKTDNSAKILDKASVDLWNMCTDTAIAGINDELTDTQRDKRTARFTKRLARFGEAYARSNSMTKKIEPDVCTACGSKNLSVLDHDREAPNVKYTLECHDCGSVWIDSYRFAGRRRQVED